jgi:serine/threonine-protein kinase HipA
MLHAWNEGMETLRSPKAGPHFRGLDTAIAEAGFSGPRKPERSRELIDRSELLAKKR